MLFALFQLKFAIITPALITGSFAERVRFSSYLLFMVLFSLFIYCPLAHWTWHPEGVPEEVWDVRDFAGGTVVHMSAGWAALAGAMFLGRRKSHMANEEAHTHRPTSRSSSWARGCSGSAGSASTPARPARPTALASLAFATTNTASASAMLGWMFFDWMRGNKPSALGACIGAVVGLVAITPAAGFVSVRESVVIGLVASVVSNLAVHLRTKSTLDDTLDVFPCHGVGGMVGMILTGVFAEGGLAEGKSKLFISHILALVIVSVFSFVGSLLLFKLTDLVIPLRVTEAQEREGLDISQHGETALGADLLGGISQSEAYTREPVGAGSV